MNIVLLRRWAVARAFLLLEQVHEARRSVVAAAGAFFVMLVTGATAVATTVTTGTPLTVVHSGFVTLQGDLVTYLGYAAVLVVAIAGIAIGLSMLVHWAKRAAHA